MWTECGTRPRRKICQTCLVVTISLPQVRSREISRAAEGANCDDAARSIAQRRKEWRASFSDLFACGESVADVEFAQEEEDDGDESGRKEEDGQNNRDNDWRRGAASIRGTDAMAALDTH